MSLFFCFSEVCLRCRLVLPLFCRRCPAGGCAFLVSGCHCLPLAFLPPIPPPALAERSSPAGKGAIYSYLMQGAPPLASPGLEPGRHWGKGANYVLGGRRAFLVSGCHCLPLAFLPPIPPTALAERSSPAGKGEIFSLLCRGLRPRPPGLNLRGTGLSRCSDCLGWHFPWNRHERRPNNRFI